MLRPALVLTLLLAALTTAAPLPHPKRQTVQNPIILNSTDPRPFCQWNSRAPQYCEGTRNLANLSKIYLCGDDRLGPARLPSQEYLDNLLEDYDRFGGLCPGEFLARWWDAAATPRPTWKWPLPAESNGFALDVNGKTISSRYTIEEGVMLDRFGSEFGRYMSPAGAPFSQRAIAPSSLNDTDKDTNFPFTYHVYRVNIAFTVEAGPIRPWFNQPGQGVQYFLGNQTVISLVNSGHIQRVDPVILDIVEQ